MDDNELHEKLKYLFTLYVEESEKFEKDGVKVSAVRARQALNDLKPLITLRRKQIQEKKSQT
jgi:hypothetical protein